MMVSLSVIIPVYNESEVISHLLRRLDQTFSHSLRQEHRISAVTYCFVDDGSTDESVQMVQDNSSHQADIKIIQLSRNFGHQAAVSAGLLHSDSDVTAIIDADLQDPPEVILEMLGHYRKGYEVIYAERARRKGSRVKGFCYWLFYRLYRALTSVPVPMDSGDFCLMGRRALDELNSLPESQRFVRGMRSWIGFPQIGVKYDRPERVAGRSKYTFSRLYELATDGIASLSIRPLRLAQFFALIYLILFLSIVIFLLFGFSDQLNANPMLSVFLFITLFSNSMILLCLYIMGSYIGRAYLEVKRRPNHIVERVITLSKEEFNYGSARADRAVE